MRLILLGPPGAGKGTQADKIAGKYDIPHISTGDIFRANIKNETELGLKAKQYIDNGELVPDSLVVSIVEDRLKQDDTANGFLLDGFPRTENQALALDEVLVNMDIELNAVINIDVDSKILVSRITGRRICKECGATFHVEFNPPAESGVCDHCGGELYQRSDDNEDTVQNRIDVYKNQTAPLIEYYSKKDLIKTIDGEQGIDQVFTDIVKTLG